MSSIYVLEPPTKGKVVLQTTHGPVDIELWPKEAPKAVRNFVQLCMEGYYDNTIFHRIIKSFLVQGGDPTGTGEGGESIYGGVFADEFHSRLRFKHRGLVACANAGSPHSNGSQFFMTLDRCDWLDKKHTIFGKVTGDSIFNLLRLGDIETDKDDRPLDPPPKIVSVEVLWNPFDDIVTRQLPGKSLPDSTTDNESKDQKKKAVKKLNLLSFGEEAEEEEKELAAVKEKIKSSHDVLNDPRLLKEDIPKREQSSSDAKKSRDLQLSIREALSSKKEESHKRSDPNFSSDEDEANFDERMRLQILNRRKNLGVLPTKQKLLKAKENSSPKDKVMSPVRTKDDDFDDQPKMDKLSLKKKGVGSEARAERMTEADGDLLLMGHAERVRQLQKMKKRRLQGRSEEVLAKLDKFKKSLSAKSGVPGGKSGVPGGKSGGDREEDLSGWRENLLAFAPGHSDKDGMTRKDDPDEYVVLDPLLEKGKRSSTRCKPS
ncbi:hypothetical protein NE237_028815 [Protea cynaroides]|uniref:PPIase cyclophilin-type domain-containing protein n=1 Tax=Protea cynaroides TaxID=273540 RepID=A0A9Q0GSR4_9MAGN|nr:hypothetical protein NE237_028815 [Protea cynaroides]